MQQYTQKLKAGLLAYGMSGKVFHAPFLEEHAGFTLDAVVERHQKKAATDYPGIKSFDSVEALIDDTELGLDLIVVNTPNNLHFEHAKLALSRHKHVLIEKPVCTDIGQLEQLFQLADKVGRQVLFYQNRRWDSDFKSCVDTIAGAALGKLHEVHFRFDRFKAGISPKIFKEIDIAGSGLQFDLGPHILDQAISLFGKPSKYYKRLSRLRPETKVPDFFSIQLSYPDNLEVFLTGSLMSYAMPPAFSLFGSQGSYFKYRADPQEDQLIAGMRPLDPAYGQEGPGLEGKLYAGHPQEAILTGGDEPALVRSPKGDYRSLFDAVYASIVSGDAFPVSRDQIRWQIEILAAPEN